MTNLLKRLQDQVAALRSNYQVRADHWPKPLAQWADIARDLDKVLADNEARIEAYREPPSGWYAFGTHAGWDHDDCPELEFSDETDEALMPLWERPVSAPKVAHHRGAIDAITEAFDLGWIHEPAMNDLIARFPKPE